MSSTRLVFSSNGVAAARRRSPRAARASSSEVAADDGQRAERLLSLGVTPGAHVTMLQTFPGVVFLCDQTELAVERGVAGAILVRLEGGL